MLIVLHRDARNPQVAVESLVRLYVQVHTAGLPGPSIPPCPDLII